MSASSLSQSIVSPFVSNVAFFAVLRKSTEGGRYDSLHQNEMCHNVNMKEIKQKILVKTWIAAAPAGPGGGGYSAFLRHVTSCITLGRRARFGLVGTRTVMRETPVFYIS